MSSRASGHVVQPAFRIFFEAPSQQAAHVRRGRRRQRRPVGFLVRTAAITWVTVSPSKSWRPVSISNSTAPNAQKIAALVHRLAGGLFGTHVGRGSEMSPAWVACIDKVGDSTRRPASRARCPAPWRVRSPALSTTPSRRILMFAGSHRGGRCPARARPPAPSAIWRAMGNASSMGIGPCAIRSASVGPSTISMTSAGTPVESSKP